MKVTCYRASRRYNLIDPRNPAFIALLPFVVSTIRTQASLRARLYSFFIRAFLLFRLSRSHVAEKIARLRRNVKILSVYRAEKYLERSSR